MRGVGHDEPARGRRFRGISGGSLTVHVQRTARRRFRLSAGLISGLTVLSLLLVAAGAQPTSLEARDSVLRASSRSDAALGKIHPTLRPAAKDLDAGAIRVHVYAEAGSDLHAWIPDAIARAYVMPSGYTTYTGTIQSRDLAKVASLAYVAMITPLTGAFVPAADPENYSGPSALPSVEQQAVMTQLMQASSGAASGIATEAVGAQPEGWADVLGTHNSAQAWDKGYTGAGVKVMVNDSGIDFAHPDLIGTQARVEDPSSPYYGWPLQFDQFGMYAFASDFFTGTTIVADNSAGTGYVDTSATVSDGDSAYQPLDADEAHAYTLPGTSQSGDYRIGTHPDRSLRQWYRIANGIALDDDEAGDERPAILVVDEQSAGVYDTVYVDMNFNFDFSDDKAARMGDEVIGADWWGAYDESTEDFSAEPDGVYDASGGMVYWVSDGVNPPPAADWWWGVGEAGNGVQDDGEPDAGALVLFSYSTWATSPAGNHGQLVASNIAGQGQTNADSFDSIFGATQLDRDTGGHVPDFKPEETTGMVTGAGRDVQLVDAGDFYSYGAVDAFVFAAVGYDGIPGTGDDVQLINNSWGSPGVDDGWAAFDRLLNDITLGINPTLMNVASSGNDGPGFGSVSSPTTETGLLVGASTQYGSTGWDSATNADQITYGDVAAFSSRGPDGRGNHGVDVVASGSRASGAMAVNEVFNGVHAWTTWGGTSRSAPVTAGNAALMYQAYYEAHGTWPTWDIAKAIMKSGAQDIGYDPFTAGTGTVDANRWVDLASGTAGAYVTPSEWEVGSYEGVEAPGFTNIMYPGETDSAWFEVNNPSDQAISYQVSSRWLQKQSEWEESFTTSPVSEEALELADSPAATVYDWNAPHYLWNVSDLIPTDTDLVVFRHNFPWEQFDPAGTYDHTEVNDFYLLAYDWTDVNGDGNLWEDLDGNGTVNEGELDAGEYVRYDYSNQRANNGSLTIHHPNERSHDGFFIGLIHNQARADVPTTTLTLGMDFYQQVDWDWVQPYSRNINVPAGDSVRVRVDVALPGDVPLGIYEGALALNDGARDTTVPVTINVASRRATLTAGTGVAEEYYNNGRVYGSTDWRGGESSGDWRMFFADLPEDPAGMNRLPDGAQYLLADAEWDALPTDINLSILGPTLDDFSTDFPEFYGPYTLSVLAESFPGLLRDGTYLVTTSGGGASEVIAAPYVPGLNAIVVHNTNLSGTTDWESFNLRAGAVGVEVSPMTASRAANAGPVTITQTFASTLALDDVVVDGFGVSKPMVWVDEPILQDDPNDFSASSFTETFTVDHGGLIDLMLDGQDSDDLDMFLGYDFDGDGTVDPNSELVAQSTTSTGDERITVSLPPDGLYQVWVHGWAVPAGSSTFSLVANVVQGNSIQASNVPTGPISAGAKYTFDITLDPTGLEPGTYYGVVTLGPSDGPSAVLIDVVFEVRE